MKRAYYTEDTIDAVARGWLDDIASRIRARPVEFHPGRSALIVLDVQRYFREPSSHAHIPSLTPVIPRIRALQSAYARLDLPAVLTRHCNTPENAGLLATWWQDLIREGSYESEIIPELRMEKAVTLVKSQYDAFHGTDLERILREGGVTQIVVTGVMTHLCCESTARSAFVKGFSVFAPVDATATYNEDFHFASLLNLAHGFAVPVMSRDILERLKAEPHGKP
jgi:bifunctional isochorismate lyase/aryl carrier protein